MKVIPHGITFMFTLNLVAERVHGITFIRFTLNLVAERVHGITFIRFTLNLVAG
jgi:hypothetical protein